MKSIVMVGGGIQELPIAKLVKELGFNLIVTDINKNAPCFEYADNRLIVDGKDTETIIAYVMRNKEKLNISGIFTCVNLTTTVSIVAQAVGLPGIKIDVAVASQNKLAMKNVFIKHNISTPMYYEVDNLEDAKQKLIEFGGKAFIKSPDNFGGRGCIKVNNELELNNAFNHAMRGSLSNTLIIEEFIEGTYHDLNGIFYNDKFYRIGDTDSFFLTTYDGKEISPIEHFVNSPSNLSNEVLDDLYDLFEKSCRALGLNFGPVAADMVITNKGNMVIEVAPRFHGANASILMIPNTLGINPWGAAIKILAGEDFDMDLITPKKQEYAINGFILPPPGKIKKIEGINEARNMDGVLAIHQFKKEEEVIPPYEDSGHIFCNIVVKGKTREEVSSLFKKIKETISVEMY